MKLFYAPIPILLFSVTGLAMDFAPGLTIGADGGITLDGVSLFVVVSETGNVPTMQSARSVAPEAGFPVAKDGAFELKGRFTVERSKKSVRFRQTATRQGSGLALDYLIEEIPPEVVDVRLALRFPASAAGSRVLADGKPVAIPLVSNAFQLMPDTVLTELVVPGKSNAVKATGAFTAFMHDRRVMNGNYFEARIKFAREGDRARLSLAVAPAAATGGGKATDDNNYQLEAGPAADLGKTGDKRFMPPLAGKNLAVSERNLYSPGRDLVYYESSRTPGLKLAMLVTKPEKPSPLRATTHGWHMDIGGFSYLPKPTGSHLLVAVDMRGRKYSQGKADCNGLELFDVYDAIQYAKVFYRELILDPEVIYFDAGSGGGGNGYALVGKFPDLFAACTALCGISDYALWYRNDQKGEFRDELDVWIGGSPDTHAMAYRSRSGLALVENLRTPLFTAHGDTDPRVGVEQARRYVARAKELGKESLITYLELPGVGDADHFGKATKEQRESIGRMSEENRQKHAVPVTIPRKGRMIVGGYLVTKPFSVFLDSIDKVATLDYDRDADKFEIHCEVPCRFEVKKH
ncbi:MAG: prolyl oligopeptidase family serine peptidase [Spirochaetes bacterium]|nr:prolyl oligopeptidase family serine peptidase [Spirochaetota bacterium]